ncbi:MAG TPA: hypothetical protein VN851_26065, partial [Thermoanaerobaculia bacterium]|nr:hypothetical protein [Thermoanaerobaculia bacterium]
MTVSQPTSVLRPLRGTLLALALAAGLAAPGAAVERWVPLGPSGGIVRDLIPAPSDRQRVVAITSEAGLGLFRSRDAGRSWQSIRQGLDGAGVITVAVAPRDPDFLVASTGSYRIWHSRDGGATWNPAARPPRTEDGGGVQTFHLLFATSGARRIYAGTERGIWRSLDGGATWDSWGLPKVFVNAIAHDPAAPATWYASGSQSIDSPNHGVFRSDDGGRTWNLAASAGGPDLYQPERLFFHAGALYAQWGGVLYRSTDGAATWSLAAHLPALSASDFALASSGKIYAATELGIYTSADGATWSPPLATSTDQAAPGDKISRLALLPGEPGSPGG